MCVRSTLVCLALLVAPATAQIRTRKLSGEMADGNLRHGTFAFDATGKRIVFTGVYEQAYEVLLYLYSAPADGSEDALRLFGPPDWGESGDLPSVGFFRITPDGSLVVFETDDGERPALHSVPIDGHAPALFLDHEVDPDLHFELSPDGSRAVYVVSTTWDYPERLYSMPVDRSAPPTLLASAHPSQTSDFLSFAITSDGKRVVYTLDELDLDCQECDVVDPVKLYSVPIDGSASPIQLHHARPRAHLGQPPRSRPYAGVLGEAVSGFVLAPDGARVVFTTREQHGRCSQGCTFVTRLFSVPADGSAAPAALFTGELADPAVDPGSSRVVFLGDLDGDGSGLDLLSQALAGGSAPVRLSDRLASGGSIARFEISSDGERVVFRGDPEASGQTGLFVVPADGSAGPTAIHAPLLPGRSVQDFRISPDSARVVYLADGDTDEVFELYAVGIDGSPLPQKLSANGAVAEFEIAPDSARVLFHASEDGIQHLFGVSIDASATPQRLSGPEGATVLVVDPGAKRALYRGSRHHETDIHLYGTPLDGSSPSMRMDDPPTGSILGELRSFEPHPDGRRVLYLAGGRDYSFPEFSLVPLEGGTPILLAGLVPDDGSVHDHRIDASTDRLVYKVQRYLPGGSHLELRSAPLDGSSAPLLLHPVSPSTGTILEFQLADGRAVYRADLTQGSELYTVPVAGSAAPLRLDPPLVGGSVAGFTLSPDKTWVVFLTAGSTGRREVYAARTDGSLPAHKLNGPLAAGGSVARYGITPDGQHVLYVADQVQNARLGLFAVPIDGSAPALALYLPALASDSVGEFALSPDSTRVAFLGPDVPHVVPIDGSAAPAPLSAIAYPSYYGIQITPDAGRVVFTALLGGAMNLFSVPMDASADPIRLNPAPVPGGGVVPWVTAPVFSRGFVLYLADHETDGTYELFSVPVDGSAPARKLNGPLAPGRQVQASFSAANGRVFFQAPEASYASHLFVAPVDGSSPAVRINPPGTWSAAYRLPDPFLVLPGGQQVLFAAASDTVGFELHSGSMGRVSKPAATPDAVVDSPAPQF